uniref:BHLH domain-containing protein n=1 Tax=Astatotilapia calliptera TaxID=8154 RepID=A0A3P8NKE8_ASTCA
MKAAVIRLRKPLVEKICRERINSSIEQLKSLLGPEPLKQHPDSKLEKPDVLEMTVCYLRRLQQRQTTESGVLEQSYSRCAQEMVNFLSKVEVKTQSQRNLLNHIKQPASPKTTHSPAPSGGRAVPRPWEGQNFNDNYCLLILWVRRHASIVLPVKAVKGRSVGNQKRLTHRAPVGTMNVDLCPR